MENACLSCIYEGLDVTGGDYYWVMEEKKFGSDKSIELSAERETRMKEIDASFNINLGYDEELRMGGALRKADNGYTYFRFKLYRDEDIADEQVRAKRSERALKMAHDSGIEFDEDVKRVLESGNLSKHDSISGFLEEGGGEFSFTIRLPRPKKQAGIMLAATYGPKGHTEHRFFKTSQKVKDTAHVMSGETLKVVPLWISSDGELAYGEGNEIGSLFIIGDHWPNYEDYESSEYPEPVVSDEMKEAAKEEVINRYTE